MTQAVINPGNHSVQFYTDEDFVHRSIAEFMTRDAHPADRHVLIARRATRDAVLS
jgi:hypothetical protein